MIGPEYTQTIALIINKHIGPIPLQNSQWLYLNVTKAEFEFDDSLKITGIRKFIITNAFKIDK